MELELTLHYPDSHGQILLFCLVGLVVAAHASSHGPPVHAFYQIHDVHFDDSFFAYDDIVDDSVLSLF